MGRVYLNFKNKKWHEVERSDFWINDWLYYKLKNLKMIQSKGWDGVIIIDGKERSGKSILGMIMAWYLSDCKMTIKNFAKGIDDASKKIATLPDKSVLIMDEGSTVFGSKDSTSIVQKRLVKIMDVVGQKNMIFIVCLPSFFDLNKTIAIRRSLFLCHVYPDKKYNRGQFAYWGEKAKKTLYIFGKRRFDSYAFPEPEFESNYFDFRPPFLQEYLETVKKESLKMVLDEALIEKPKKRSIDQMRELIEGEIFYKLKKNFKFNNRKIATLRNQSERTILKRIQYYKEDLEMGVLSPS